MKTILLTLITSSVLLIGTFKASYAQQRKQFVGSTEQLIQQLSSKKNDTGARIISGFDVTVDTKTTLTITPHATKQNNNTHSFVGHVAQKESSSFFLNIKGNEVNGKIILKDQKQAYEFSSDAKGNVYVQPVDINKVMCIDFNELPSSLRSASKTSQRLSADVTSDVYALQSLPGSAYTAYLDFDGEYLPSTAWNGGNPIDAAPSGMSDDDIHEAWEITSEDYSLFDINITTDVNVFNNTPAGKRIRCLISPTNTAGPGYGGIAYIGSFNWTGFEEPCWAFTSGVGTGGKNVGEVCSHEIGHTVFLQHDGRTQPSEVYYAGAGDWAPIMGVGYYKSIVQWSQGEYLNANNQEDDINIIATQNGFTYRTDDHGDDYAHATSLVLSNEQVLSDQNHGVISQRRDVDVFSFTTTGGALNLNFNTAPRHADLDIIVKLYNQNNELIQVSDPDGLSASLTNTVSAGKYYVYIDGTGHGDPLVDGYTDYSSIGSFSISGSIPQVNGPNVAPIVFLTAPSNNAEFTAPANVILTASASDSDGNIVNVEFFEGNNKLGEAFSSPYALNWNNVAAGSYTLTAKATDNLGAYTISTVVSVLVNTIITDNCGNTALWNGVTVYSVPGQHVSYLGGIYENKWWTQNEQPDKTNIWGVWKYIGPCNNGNVNPVVSFTAPINTFDQEGNTVVFIAAASDADGSIQKVDFYENEQLVFSSTTVPYTYTKNGLEAGGSAFKAIATDNLGATSDPAYLILYADTLPTFVSPIVNDTYVSGSNIMFQLNVHKAESRIAKVEYFLTDINNKVGESFTSPYQANGLVPATNGTQEDVLPVFAKVTYANGGTEIINTAIHVVHDGQINLCNNLNSYKENNGYAPGSTVQSNGRIYECKAWPYSGWCNSAAVAYGPGIGTVWQDAWTDKGSCTGNANRQSDGDNSMLEKITVYPNPASESVRFDFGTSGYSTATVTAYDALGNQVDTPVIITTNEALDISAYAKGVYHLHIALNDQSIHRQILKY
ncbi:MAG: peptidase domain protein [Chitinophagaceae bacterium]|nr:peptidase domain protein [Chitinophagaceae bacterium]